MRIMEAKLPPSGSGPDALAHLDVIDKETFEWEVNDIFLSIKNEQKDVIDNPGNKSPLEMRLPSALAIALARTREKYVNNAEYAELANLADVILSAPEAARVQEGLNKINNRLSQLKKIAKDQPNHQLPPELATERSSLRSQRKLEVAKILPWNHKLRELIDTVADVVPRKDVENWIERAMQGAGGTARKVVAGMGSEVAVARLARQLYGGDRVRLSTQSEDAKGTDMVITTRDGREVAIDIKTGGNIDDLGSRQKEVAINQNQIEGFDVREDQKRELEQRIRVAIE